MGERDVESNPGKSKSGSSWPWLNRNVVGMGVTSLLSDLGHEMATSVLAGFLAVIGAPAYALGLLEGIADAVSSFVKLGAGWWSDRLGHRKSIVTIGYALTGLSTGFFALARGWGVVLSARVIGWFGRGIRGPLRDAMLAESVSPTDRGKAFGFHRAGDTVGAIIGPLIGAGLLVYLHPHAAVDSSYPFRIIFWVSLVPGLGSALAFAWMVKEKRRSPNYELKFWASLNALPGNFRRFLVGVGVFGAGDFAHTLLILGGTQLLLPAFGPVKAAWVTALLYAVRNVLYTVASYPVGHLSDHYNRRNLLVGGYVLAAVVMCGFAGAFLLQTRSILWLGGLFAGAGVYIAMEDALEGALTADLVPDEKIRGTAFGVMGTVNGVGDFISSALVGALWSISPVAGFLYAATMMALGAGLLYRIR